MSPAPQSFCCLPWCGRSYSEPTHSRVFIVDGRKTRLTYPAMIDMHDVIPRSRGGDPLDLDNNVPLCHEHHMAHHDGRRRLDFRYREAEGGRMVPHEVFDGCEWRELVLDAD